jgi:excisionase family DNA binding protein
MADEDPVLKVPEVARRLRVSAETVRRWLRDGELRGVRFSDRGGWRVLSSEVERKLRGEWAAPAVTESRVAEPRGRYRADGPGSGPAGDRAEGKAAAA